MKNNYWLIKEEPTKYSYNDLVNDKKTAWNGIGNNLALKHIREILKGDDLLYDHTEKEKSVIGIAKVIRGSYSNPNKELTRSVTKEYWSEIIKLSNKKYYV